MIVIEYQIPMPLQTEEYRIAQLYMIAKKSRLESEGQGSGVEIISNEPYSDGPGGGGQYTDKIYHVEAHLPYWLRGFLPKSLALIREEAWNAYPYSKNSIYMPNMDKFRLDMESKYLIGGPGQENVFGLSEKELSERTVDVVDFVADPLFGKDYVPEEDSTTYVSKKTGRGPLTLDWLEKYTKEKSDLDVNEISSGEAISNEKDTNLMCVYKICKVRFDQWGLQTRVERYIHDYIRKALIRAHRQAWAWQDEWHDLSMDEIRKMERDVQEALAKLMKKEES